MKICLINFDSSGKNKKENLEKKEALIKQALEFNPEISTIVFPELSLTGYVLDEDVYALAEDENGESILKMKELAKKYGVNLIFGFIEKNGKEKPFNSTLVISKIGEILAKYSKNHLFTQSIEPEIYSAGTGLTTFELDGWKCGLSICFDIRYPRLYEAYKKKGVECVFTGYAWVDGRNKPDIFASLSKGRSSENQFFMAGVDSIGKDENNSYSGNAIVSNPYGEDIKQTRGGIFHFAELDKNEIASIKKMLPLDGGFKKEYKF